MKIENTCITIGSMVSYYDFSANANGFMVCNLFQCLFFSII